jgi:hypothetical protein
VLDVLAGFNNRISGEQILADIANQVRLANVQQLLGSPTVTPYDVFRVYRDQNERVAAKLIELPVEKFLAQVPEPTQQDIQTYYDAYKEVLPDPSQPTPGFKVPRQIKSRSFARRQRPSPAASGPAERKWTRRVRELQGGIPGGANGPRTSSLASQS